MNDEYLCYSQNDGGDFRCCLLLSPFSALLLSLFGGPLSPRITTLSQICCARWQLLSIPCLMQLPNAGSRLTVLPALPQAGSPRVSLQVTPTALLFPPTPPTPKLQRWSSLLNDPGEGRAERFKRQGIHVMCYSRAALATAVAAAAAASHLARLHHFLLTLRRGVVAAAINYPTPYQFHGGGLFLSSRKTQTVWRVPKGRFQLVMCV